MNFEREVFMNKYNTLFEVINVYLDLCLESIDSKSFINACTACPFREFKDEAMTCASLKLTEKVFEALPIIYRSKIYKAKRRKK